MFDNINTLSANHIAARQHIKAGRRGEDELLKGASEWGWKWIEVTLNCWSTGIFRHTISRVSWEYETQRRETIQWVTVVWREMPRWCKRRVGWLSRRHRETGSTRTIATKQRGPKKAAFEWLMCGLSSQRQTAPTQKPQFKKKKKPHI